jgi:hypothetical protein
MEIVKTQEEIAAESAKVAAEQAAVIAEQSTRIKLATDDMIAMGMPPEEIEAELAKQAASNPAPVVKAAVTQEKKPEESAAVKPEDKSDKALQDMLFTKSREAKLKANEEAASAAREARKATMTAEQIAAEDKRYEDALESGRQKDVKLVTYEQNAALAKLREAMSVEEWALIAPTLDEYVQSKEDYDNVIFDGKGGFRAGVDYAKHIADLVTKARGANVDKITELRLKKIEADKSVKKEIDNLHVLSGHKAPADKTQSKSELDILKERAIAGLQTSAEAERMTELLDKEP